MSQSTTGFPRFCRLATMLLLLAHGTAAWGATRYVDAATGVDTGDCSAIGSPCLTISYALGQSAPTGGDTISVAAGTYTTAAEIDVDRAITITGAGATSTIVQAAASAGTADHRLFKNNNFVTTIENMTIRHGVEASGGAINNNFGTLTLNNVFISDNQARDTIVTGLNGGAISINSGTLNINNSTISGNSVTTSDATSFGNGGGIFVGGSATVVNINNSTVSGNSAKRGGGGVYINAGALHVNYSTIANNSSDSDDDTVGDGGGVARNGGTLTLESSIVAGNKKAITSATDNDCSGTITSQGYNLTGSSTGCSFAGTGDITVNPSTVFTSVLSSLSDNGGQTPTHALITGSGAIDAIPNGTNSCGSGSFTIDQRGGTRPYNSNCDMGAFEQLGTVHHVSPTGADSGDCTITDCLTLDYAYSKSLAGNTIELAAGTYTTSAEINIGRNITIRGAGAANTFVQAAASAGIANHRLFKNNNFVTTIEDMTIRYGVEASGGAINSANGTLTLNSVIISDNQARDTIVTGLNGGAISINSGTLNINNSTISGNSVTTSDPTSFGNGGGIFVGGSGTVVNINNSTVSGNSAKRGGGGVYINAGALHVNYSTIANNTSDSDDDTVGDGGGIARNGGTLTLESSIVAGNKKAITSATDNDCSGTITSQGYNLTGSGTGCTLGGAGNVTVDPSTVFSVVLGALSANDGSTPTHALLTGSPARDIVPSATAQCGNLPFDLDQRGFSRPFASFCDSGAYEGQGSADLAISKTDGVTIVAPGGTVTYTIIASNPTGPNNAPSVTVTDTFPAALTCTWTCGGAGGGTCAAAGSGNISDTAGLPVGASVTYTASCTVAMSATGSLANTATVAAGAGVTDPTPGNNSATDTDTVTPQADLAISKTDGVTTAIPGADTVTYTIVASNLTGPNNAPSVTVTDSFPAALTCTWTCGGASGGTCTASGSGSISDTAGLPVGASVTYIASCTIAPSATGSLANTATVAAGAGVTDPTPGNNSATDTDTLTPEADLAITKTDGITSAIPGGSVTYSIVARNQTGPSDAPGVTVTDTFPAALTCTWTCGGADGGTCGAGGSDNISDTANLPVGASVTYTASCTIAPSATGSLANTSTVAAGAGVTDPTPGNNSATDTDTLTPEADLAITKTDGVITAPPGGSVTYTIVARNQTGPSNAPGVTVTDTFPAALTCTWTCGGADGGTCSAGGNSNISDTVNLPVGGSVTYTASCTVALSATGSLANTATVAAGGGVTDPTPGNNSDTDTDTLTPEADLTISKADGVATTTPGGSLTYTIVASNPTGPSHAPSVTVTDTFPAALINCTWSCGGAGGGTCTAAGSGDISDSAGLPVGASVTYTASCTVDSSATNLVLNTASVTPGGGVTDPLPANNSATDVDTLPTVFADGLETGDTSRWSGHIPAGMVVWGISSLGVEGSLAFDYDLALLRSLGPLATGPLAAVIDDRGEQLFVVEARGAGPDSRLQLRLVAQHGSVGLVSDWQDVAARWQELRLEWQPATPGGNDATLALYLGGRLALWLEGFAHLETKPASVLMFRPDPRARVPR